MSEAELPAASIVIACFTAKRWSLLSEAIESALAQTHSPEDVIVVVDHNDDLLQRVSVRWGSVTVLANRFGRGASGARNTGVFAADSPFVAFLDDDAVAEPDWLANLLRCFVDPSVVGVGGGVTAAWAQQKPHWFPDEFGWVVGASYQGLPMETAEVRNVWAENMAVRRDCFLQIGGFRLNFGKVGAQSSPEDTDLCIRMAEAGGRWLYVPDAVVAHHVPADRSTFWFFLRRCYVEGRGKAALAGLTTKETALTSERNYALSVLPQAVRREVRDAVVERDVHHASRAATVIIGLAFAGAGYVRHRLVPSH